MNGAMLVTRRSGMIEADAGGELVGLDVESGTCFGFNATATRVWQLIETPQTVDALVAALMAEHDVEEGECRDGLAELLRSLEAEGLVRLDQA